MKNVVIVSIGADKKSRDVLTKALYGISRDFQSSVIAPLKAALVEAMRQAVEDTLNDTELRSPTGMLHRVLRSGVSATGTRTIDNLRAVIRAPGWVSLHEYGGTIRPVNSKALALPLPAALRPDGTPKRRGPNSWRSLGTRVFRSKKTGRSYIVYTRGRGKQAETVYLYVLVEEAHFKPKLGLRRHVNQVMPAILNAWAGILYDAITGVDLFAEAGKARPSNYRAKVLAGRVSRASFKKVPFRRLR